MKGALVDVPGVTRTVLVTVLAMQDNGISILKTIFGSHNDLSPLRCQAIIWTNADCCQLDRLERISVKFESNTTILCKKEHL